MRISKITGLLWQAASVVIPVTAAAQTCVLGANGVCINPATGQAGNFCIVGEGIVACPAPQPTTSNALRYGSPHSLQFQAATSSLDMFDVQSEGEEVFTYDGDSDTIGGAFTYDSEGPQKAERYDLHYQHAQRLGEGSRARLLIDVPVSITRTQAYDGAASDGYTVTSYPAATAVSATVNLGVELPVKPNWLITPRLAYSNAQGGAYFGYDAELVSGSLTSRYRITGLGRGDLIIGDAVTYAHTINTFLAKQPLFDALDLWTFRNGLAYQLPLKGRLFGRQASIRASYVFTQMTGTSGLAYRQVHEAGISIGVRSREAAAKTRAEMIRIGLLYTHANNQFTSANDYDSLTLTLGYRF